MADDDTAARQFSFRLPEPLVERLERCRLHLCSSGLDLTRADVVRLLLNHALDTTKCRIDLLLGRGKAKSRSRQ